MKKLLIASAIIAILAISCNHEFPDRKTKLTAVNQTFTTHGNLQVIGTQLSDGNGDPVQLRGMSTHGLQYRGDCYNEASLDLLTDDWGVDILRISMYVQEGGYEDDPVFFTKFVDSLVGECYDRGIYALIDWHMLHPGDPNANTALAKVFFEHVSEEHADKGNVLYEICNEPNNDNYTVAWPMIKNYAEEIIPIIRNNDPNSVIIVGTPEFASRPDWVIGDEINYDNLMYTMHFYAADPGQTDRMGYVSGAIAAGIPVFVTEFGTQDGWGDGENDFDMSQKWLNFLKEHKVSWCNWNYSDSDRSGAVWKEDTCPDGPWTHENLKVSGVFMKAHFKDEALWDYDLGSGTGSGTAYPPSGTVQTSSSTEEDPGFLPYPPTGTAQVSTAAAAGAGFDRSGTTLNLGASNGNVPNKLAFSKITEGSEATSLYFTVNFNSSTQGTAVFALGNSSADIFTNTAAYTNAEQEGLFGAIRFFVGNCCTNPEYRYEDAGSYFHREGDTDLFSRTVPLEVEIHCNNTASSKTYYRGISSYTIAPNSYHVVVNDQFVTYSGSPDLVSTGELENEGRIDAVLFTGSDSAGNTLDYSLSNIRLERIAQNN
ncbi:Cellulase (glycosyl hydrolase family 5) [Sinomicrobium oceani]|uniref:Cellulase (Glycosyl hydrolase family 5) n=1 Tax=Sinomicrobium oceani TaxID=1150368 RepID=A0A1K1NNX5_9FLAO|nr:glycoside hydrolase family 5 protein [Sinomicrobium oceani]SFW36985.1 Cellulase (glycosyl hydrolase family 5) [Sinomicrobium oceani]